MSDTGPSDHPSDGSLDNFTFLDKEHVPAALEEETDKSALKVDNFGHESLSPLQEALGVAEEKDGDSIDASLVPLAVQTPPKEDPKPEQESDNDLEPESLYSVIDAEEINEANIDASIVPSTEEIPPKEEPKPEQETDKGVLHFDDFKPEPSHSLLDAEEIPPKEEPKPEQETDKGALHFDDFKPEPSHSLLDAEEIPPKEEPKLEQETDKGALHFDDFKPEPSHPVLDAKEINEGTIDASIVPSTEEIPPKEEPKSEHETDKLTSKADNFERELPSFLGVAEEKDGHINTPVVPSTEEIPKEEIPKLEEETGNGALKVDVLKENDGNAINVSISPSHPEKEAGVSPSLEQEMNADLKTDKRVDLNDTEDFDPLKISGGGVLSNEPAHVQQEKDDEINLKDKETKQKIEWEQEKEKCLAESIEERKKRRKCTELSSIKTWPDYYRQLKPEYDIATADDPDLSNKVSLWTGDITTLLVDAIVNAANETLMGGGGVDGAIHSAAGPFLKKECKKFNGCCIGDAVITCGYNLPAKYVIHTVGPRGEHPTELSRCYYHSLERLVEEGQRTIAFPCISTGIFGYPNDKAAEVAVGTVRAWLKDNPNKVDRVIFCLFLDRDIREYEQTMQTYFAMTGRLPEDIPTGSSSNENIRNEEESDDESPLPRPVENNNHHHHHDHHPIEHADEETAALLSTEKRSTRNTFWDLFSCCFKDKTK